MRYRHVPGSICLTDRRATAFPFEATAGLQASIDAFASGHAEDLSVAKVSFHQTRPAGPACGTCGDVLREATLDLGLGPNSGIVIESVPGQACRRCHVAVLEDRGAEAMERLGNATMANAVTAVPSLKYDTPDHPTSLQIEITTRCNLGCSYCGHSELPHKADVPYEEVLSWFDRIELPKVANLDYTGLGEPLLHPRLADIVAEARRRGCVGEQRFVTNGTVLTPERFIPVCEAGLTSIAISIDSLDATRFAEARSGARLDRVLENLESLVAYRDRAGRDDLRIRIKAVLVHDPYGEAARILDYAARLGIDLPHFAALDDREAARALYVGEHATAPDWPASHGREFAEWVHSRWRELGGRAPRFDDTVGRDAGPPGKEVHYDIGPWSTGVAGVDPDLCRWAVDACFIAAGGGFLSCCETMIDIPRTTFGQLSDGRLSDVWGDELLWSYRLPLALGRLPAGCVGCAYAPPGGVALKSM